MKSTDSFIRERNSTYSARGIRVWAFTVSMVLAAGRARAADDVATQTPRDHFESAVNHVKTGNLELAAHEFARAYALDPHPATLLNLARVQAKLERYLEAHRSFTAWLADPATQSSLDQRAKVEQERQTLVGRLGQLVYHITPELSHVTVNGHEVAPNEQHSVVAPGNVVVRVDASGYASVTREFAVDPGATLDVRLTLTPDAKPTPPATAPPPAGTDAAVYPSHVATQRAETESRLVSPYVADEATSQTAWWQHTWLYPGLGAVVLGGVAVGLERYANWRYVNGYVPSDRAMSEWKDVNREWYDANVGELREQKDTIDELNTAAVVLAIGSGVCAASAITLFLLEDSPSDGEAPKVSLQLQPNGVTVRGVF